MYSIIINGVTNLYDYQELIKIFLPPDGFKCYLSNDIIDEEAELLSFNNELSSDKNQIKREIYNKLSQITGQRPAWGILTGVRPVKLTGELFKKTQGSEEKVRNILAREYLLDEQKIELLINTYNYQQERIGDSDDKALGVYIGIPFCPTRCLYCSFTSNQVGEEQIELYLQALKKEIQYVARRMKETGIYAESIYIGGGTPTTLSDVQLDDLIEIVKNSFELSRLKEFTIEAGRPDTITIEKLKVIKKHGIDRISINPQSMKEKTLELIGRSHKPSDIIGAFEIANQVGIKIINADLIAGLPEESPEDFKDTLDRIIDLNPENITVHTLAVKRASRLVEVDKDYHYRQGQIVKDMLDIAKEKLSDNGFRPYYLYRQKHMAGSFENVGYCKGDTPCIYNIRIMEEHQSILALGAGGISKIYFPKENRLERIPNVSNYQIYISRIDEMLDRKENNFFKEVEKHVN